MDGKYDNSHKVYEKEEFIILKVHSGKNVGYIAYNTHLDSFDMAKTIISNIIKFKKPKTSNMYLLKSHIRLSNDPEYTKYIEELIDAKKSKCKQPYRNRNW